MCEGLVPTWYETLLHQHAKHHGYCKVCLNANDKLYHCGDCMVGIYCSSECQRKDSKHACLIGAKGGKKKRLKTKDDDRLIYRESLGMLANVPRDVLQMILSYLSPKEIRDARLVARYLNQIIGPRWVQTAQWVIDPTTLNTATIPRRIAENVFNVEIYNEIENMDSLNLYDEMGNAVPVFPNLRHLKVEDYISDDIEWLRNYPKLRYLEILFNLEDNISENRLNPIHSLANLETLSLSATVPVTFLKPLTKLKELIVNNVVQNSNDIINNIKTVHLENTATFDFLSSMPEVTTLGVSSSVYHVDLNPLLFCRHLKSLRLSRYNNSAGIAVISRLTNLETLILPQFNKPLNGMLVNLTKLKTLSVGARAEDNLLEFATLNQLVKLNLGNYSGNTLIGIANMQNLKVLRISSYTGELRYLEALPELTELDISGYNNLSPDQLMLLNNLRLKTLYVNPTLTNIWNFAQDLRIQQYLPTVDVKATIPIPF
jgi:hypothetical protein